MAFSPFDETAARVVFYGGSEPLEELCLQDEDGNDLSNPAVKLSVERTEDSPENGGGHKLFGIPVGYEAANYSRPIEGWVMLLQISSNENVEFEDGGTLCFFIEPDKLRNGDFSDVRVMIVPKE